MEFGIFVKFFVSLIAVVNPVGIMPVFVTLTQHMDESERIKTALVANLAMFIILCLSLVVGKYFLEMFSISINSFKIAGGMILLMIAFSMISGKIGEDKQNKQEQNESKIKEQIGIVPLALPLLAGPGAISATIVYGTKNPGIFNILATTLTLGIFAITCWILFRTSHLIVKFLGQTGINVITRIMGIVLASMGIEMIIQGIKILLPGLG